MDNRKDTTLTVASSDDLDQSIRAPEDPSSHSLQHGSKSSSFKPKRQRAMLMTRIMPGLRRQDRAMVEYRHAHYITQLRMEAARKSPTLKSLPRLPATHTNEIFRPVPHGMEKRPWLPPACAHEIFRPVTPAKESLPRLPPTCAHEIVRPVPLTKESLPCMPTPSKPVKINTPKVLEYEGFDDILRPGIWDIDAQQFGHFDKVDGLDIAEQIKLKAQLDDSYETGSYSTEPESISYERSSYYESPSEMATTDEPPRRGNRVLRFFRRLKKVFF